MLRGMKQQVAFCATSVVVGLFLPACSRGGGDFTLTDLDGRSVSLSDFQGKVVLLSFRAVG